MNVSELLMRLGKVKKVGHQRWMALCPGHDDHNRSLSVGVNGHRILLHCFAGCSISKILKALHLEPRDLFLESTNPLNTHLPEGIPAQWYGKPFSEIWSYKNAKGSIIGHTVRYDNGFGKDIIPFFKNVGGKWKSGGPKKPKPLYGLNRLAENPKGRVLVVEGEKSADAAQKLLGEEFVCVSWLGGCKQVKRADWAPLEGRSVYIWPDADAPGIEAANDVAKCLQDLAAEINIVKPPKNVKKGWDLADALEDGWDKEEVLQRIERCAAYRTFSDGNDIPGTDENKPGGDEGKRVVVMRKFSPRPYSEMLMEKYNLIYDKHKRLWLYNEAEGSWQEGAELVLESELRKNLLGEEQVCQHYVKEIIADVSSLALDPNAEFDLDPNLIAFANGVLDIKTDEFRKPRPVDLLTTKLPVNYKPNARCPLIDKIFSDLVEDPTDLYELTAYCLWRGYPYHKVFFLYGSGGNGKSVFQNILILLLGAHNVKAIDLASLCTNRFASAELYGKLAAICGEIRYSELKDTDLLKRLTGGDAIRAERKYKDPFDYHNYAKIIVSANEIPKTSDKTRAFYRRVYLIQFPNVFEGTGREDKTLLSKVGKEELEGLAAKAVRYLQQLIKRGFFFTNDKPTDELERDYERLSNPLAEFLEQFTVEDPEGMIPRHHLRELFNLWQKSKGRRTWTDKAVTQEMKLLGHEFAQRTVDYESSISQLSQVSQLISNKSYIYKNCSKKPVKVVKVVKNNPVWRCWLGLAWRLDGFSSFGSEPDSGSAEDHDGNDNTLHVSSNKFGSYASEEFMNKGSEHSGCVQKVDKEFQEPEWLQKDFKSIENLVKRDPGPETTPIDTKVKENGTLIEGEL